MKQLNIIIGVAVTIVVIIGIVLAVVMIGLAANVVRTEEQVASAGIIVTVQSNDILFSVNYNVYVNGALEMSGSIPAGSGVTHTLHVMFPMEQSGRYNVVILATASGVFGSSSDSEPVTLSNGGTYPVTLVV